MNPLIKYLIALFITFAMFSVGVNAQIASRLVKIQHTYKLADTTLKVVDYSVGDRNQGMVYFHPHDSEQTSIQAIKQILPKHGGKAFVLENNGDRIVSFKMGSGVYRFDPNRIFTLSGVTATLKRYGRYSDEARDATFQFGQWLSGLLSSARVFAIHNNRNTTYNVLSYRGGEGNPIKGIKSLYINPKDSAGSFVYTTNMGLYMASKNSGFNYCVAVFRC